MGAERDLYVSFLKKVFFLENLSETDYQAIASLCVEVLFEPEEILCNEDERASKCFILIDGVVEVWKNWGKPEKNLLGYHCAGHLIGEMALLDNLPRSATIKAQTKVRALTITADEFKVLISKNNAINLCLLKSLSKVIRDFNEIHVSDMVKRNLELESACQELRKIQNEALVNERLSLMGQYASNILHDIKNPLSVIKNRIEMIEQVDYSKDALVQQLEGMKQDVQRMEFLASEFLDFARGDIRLDLNLCDIAVLAKKIEIAMQLKLEKQAIQFSVINHVNTPVILDQDRLLRALINVIENARKALTEKHDEPKISIVFSLEKNILLISVSDNGCGMSKLVLSRVFEPFFSYSSGGTGLGMQIVKSVVQAHSGEIVIDSTEGFGTVVSIQIPTKP